MPPAAKPLQTAPESQSQPGHLVAPDRSPSQAERGPTLLSGILPGSISVKIKAVEVPQRQPIQKEAPPLTQQTLQETWDAVLEEWQETNPQAVAILQGHEVQLRENAQFIISTTNSGFERDFRPIQTDLLEALRKRLQCHDLNCRIERNYEEQERVVYQPIEKYNAMLADNPELAQLREIFRQIDY